MSKEEIIQFLKENLEIEIKEGQQSYATNQIVVKLLIDGEVISQSAMDVPEKTTYCDF